jgi:hypothetical protein
MSGKVRPQLDWLKATEGSVADKRGRKPERADKARSAVLKAEAEGWSVP